MIQRIQTVFLLLATLLAGSLFLLPVKLAVSHIAGTPSAPINGMTCPVLGAALGVLALVALVTIFQYKNRPLQARISMLGSLATVLLILALLLFPRLLLNQSETTELQNGVGFYLLFGVSLCFVLAARFIRKDEALVRSADRIR